MFVQPDGKRLFGADHFSPKKVHDSLRCVYENLVYCCNLCNSLKTLANPPLNPETDDMNSHVSIDPDTGRICSMTPKGRAYISLFDLDSRENTDFRKNLLGRLRYYQNSGDASAKVYFLDLVGFPGDLPQLHRKRPRSNKKPQGAAECFFVRRERNDLPESY